MEQTLFHQNAYLACFEAQVVDCRERDGLFAAELSNTGFYYTSGGQPHDTGVLGGAKVLDVIKENGRILHIIDGPLEQGSVVKGEIDWPRRFDHMCQHAGEHLIAWAIGKRFGGATIGLHIGSEVSTLDVDMGGGALSLSADKIGEIEGMIMEKVLQNVPIKCYFPSKDELPLIGLRKKPTVDENVRVVSIGDFEHVACGGTHPRSAGEIGLVKILDAKPNRGNMRISFLAGMRAYRAFQLLQNQADAACALLSAKWDGLSGAVQATLDRQKQAEKAAAELQIRTLLSKKDELLAKARLCAEGRVAIAVFDLVCDDALRGLCSAIASESDAAALLFSRNAGRVSAVFARGSDVPVHVGNLLREVFQRHGGKGGGRPDFAMGSLPEGADIDALRTELLAGFA